MLKDMRQLLLFLLVFTACGDRSIPILVNDWCDTPREETVAEIIDGDTLVLEGGETVRILGIDAPERYYTGHPDCSSEESSTCCYGEESSLALLEIIPPGSRIRLEFDLECTGIYDRTLAYLFLSNDDTGAEEIFLNEWLIEEGLAKVYEQDVGQAKDIRYLERFQDAQTQAQSQQKGLWDLCF